MGNETNYFWRWAKNAAARIDCGLASAMSTGTAKTPKAVEGRSPASAVPKGETPND